MTEAPLIITCAVVGAELTRKEYPYLPLTPDEIADSACEAARAGASIIHLHVRDKQGKPTQDIEVFNEVSLKIKKRTNAIIQFSTGGAVGTPLEDRCAPLELEPDMASITMGSINFGDEVFINDENTVISIAKSIKKNKIMPELEIFDYGMLETAKRFIKKGIIPKKCHVDFVLGVPGGMDGTIRNLSYLVSGIPESQTWSVSGIGKCQLPLSIHAIAMGGHVRVGIEDNIYYRKGELVKSNRELVERVVRIAKEADRPVAGVEQARNLLGLQSILNSTE